MVVRNGKGRNRNITLGAGTIPLSAPRVNDRRTDQDGARRRFTSRILPRKRRPNRRADPAGCARRAQVGRPRSAERDRRRGEGRDRHALGDGRRVQQEMGGRESRAPRRRCQGGGQRDRGPASDLLPAHRRGHRPIHHRGARVGYRSAPRASWTSRSPRAGSRSGARSSGSTRGRMPSGRSAASRG